MTAKVSDFDFHRLPLQLIEFKDHLRELLNFGKVQFQALSGSTAPTYPGNPGELTFVRNGTDSRGYVYRGTSWNLAFSWTGDAAGE